MVGGAAIFLSVVFVGVFLFLFERQEAFVRETFVVFTYVYKISIVLIHISTSSFRSTYLCNFNIGTITN